MAINPINGASTPPVRGVSRSERTASPTAERANSLQSSSVASADELRLTPESLRLQKLATSLSAEPTFNKERVEALRKAIDSGEYQADATRVAKRLLGLEGELFK